jgi:hypothetical protein
VQRKREIFVPVHELELEVFHCDQRMSVRQITGDLVPVIAALIPKETIEFALAIRVLNWSPHLHILLAKAAN